MECPPVPTSSPFGTFGCDGHNGDSETPGSCSIMLSFEAESGNRLCCSGGERAESEAAGGSQRPMSAGWAQALDPWPLAAREAEEKLGMWPGLGRRERPLESEKQQAWAESLSRPQGSNGHHVGIQCKTPRSKCECSSSSPSRWSPG